MSKLLDSMENPPMNADELNEKAEWLWGKRWRGILVMITGVTKKTVSSWSTGKADVPKAVAWGLRLACKDAGYEYE